MVTKAGQRSTAGCQIRISWQPATEDAQQRKNISCKEAFDFQSCVKCSQENHVNAHRIEGRRISLETLSCFTNRFSRHKHCQLAWGDFHVLYQNQAKIKSLAVSMCICFEVHFNATPVKLHGLRRILVHAERRQHFPRVSAKGKDYFFWSASEHSGAVDTDSRCTRLWGLKTLQLLLLSHPTGVCHHPLPGFTAPRARWQVRTCPTICSSAHPAQPA